VLLAAMLCGSGSSSLWAQEEKEAAPTDIPVRRVVMFSSGVAFYEHRGEVDGDAQVDL
jgi:hypothetical protein